MKRWLWVLTAGLGVGCSPTRTPVAVPGPRQSAAEPVPVPSETELPPPPDLHLARALSDSLLKRLAVDSLQDQKDMEILERLRDVAVAGDSMSIGTEAGVDLAEMFDINVARYAEHTRVRYYLDFFQGPARERMTVWLGRLPVYEPMIKAALSARGLPNDLKYLALIESGYSNTAVSRSKAVGMWQFMRPTARDYGLKTTHWVDERRDPVKATAAAARFLSDLTKRFDGSYYLAAAAYNSGGGTVSRGLRKLGAGAAEDYFDDDEAAIDLAEDPTGDDRFFHLSESRFLRQETKDYVPKLIAAAMIAKQPEKYGFPPIPAVEPFEVDSVPVTEPTSLEVVAKVAGLDFATITGLNPFYIRGITPPDAPVAWVRVPIGRGREITEALAAVPTADRLPAQIHVVQRKETMRSVSRKYGITAAALAEFNPGLTAKSPLKLGAQLRVPGRALVRGLVAADRQETITRRARVASRGTHRIARGETLGALARRYRVTVAQLAAWNGLSARSSLRIGQVVRIGSSRSRTAVPSKSGSKTVHIVRRGETLSSVARRYRVTVTALREANGLRPGGDLKTGKRLTIPG